MLKKTQTRAAGAGTQNTKTKGDIRLFKVVDVTAQGVVVEFTDGKTTGQAFLEATPKFVTQKNASPNFMAKADGSQMHDKFYMALMRPTSNADHQYRKGMDIISAKLYPRNGTATVGDAEIPKFSLASGFNIFARAESKKPDPFDSEVVHHQEGDKWFHGLARIIHDPEAPNKATGGTGTAWMEFVSEKGNPSDINSLFEHVREITKAKQGTAPSVFVRILDENGENDQQTTFYPEQKAEEVESTLEEIRALNLPVDRIASWEVHPRVYLREDFLKSANDSASKLERLRRDIAYTYGIDLEKTPLETKAVEKNGRRVGGESFAIPMAVSLTMYSNESTGNQWVPGSLRSVVPIGDTVVHSRDLFKTPEQRERARLNAPAQQAAQEHAEPEAQAPQQQEAAPATPAAGMDIDFGT